MKIPPAIISDSFSFDQGDFYSSSETRKREFKTLFVPTPIPMMESNASIIVAIDIFPSPVREGIATPPVLTIGPPGNNGVPSCGVFPGGVSPGGVFPGGVSPGGVSPGGVSPGGVSPGGVSPGGVSPGGVFPGGFGGVSSGGVVFIGGVVCGGDLTPVIR